MNRSGNVVSFEKSDAVYFRQLTLAALSTISMKEKHVPVTSFERDTKIFWSSKEEFFSHLHNMVFNISAKRFEVAGPESLLRNRFVTRKVVKGANEALTKAAADAQEMAIAKASQILGQKIGRATVDAVIEEFSKIADLNADDIKLIKNKIIPILVIMFTD